MRDLDFVSGRFFEYEVPKDKAYLLKYFKNDLQRSFLKYYMVFGDWKNFRDHTGHACTDRVLWRFERRYKVLTAAHAEAKGRLDEAGMAMVGRIESGKFVLTGI